MKRVRRFFNLKDLGRGKEKDTAAGTAVSTGSHDEDTRFTLNVETFSFKQLSDATAKFNEHLLIGSGGSANVYEGHLPGIGKIITVHYLLEPYQVAVKRLSFDGVSRHKAAHLQRGFLREVFVLNSINHPNIVRLIGCCSEESERLLVYEYIYWGSMRKCLRELDWQKRMNIALGAAKGLERLHLQVNPSIVHREIKSDNILLCLDFEPKVSDFGSAKIAPAGGAGSGWVGTFGYMAPEVAFGKSLSIRSDIYSFGVVLLELITGRKAIDCNREDEEQHLASWVLAAPNLVEL
ncbi:hypothetical protein C2845_PM13G23820 [Panicum miliaceum]|uniref:Protein kinase domain-containing protein n=1 Tax=Panicum miliaceum TaxID=4540 RepID=A0A3L6RGF3_PANMI|nr:hypothetical protein C2845_PM13G23820 [Panicum miliaceum]